MDQSELNKIVASITTRWHPPGGGTELAERKVAFSKAQGNLLGIDPNLAERCGLSEQPELTVDLENDPILATFGPAAVQLRDLGISETNAAEAITDFRKRLAVNDEDPEGHGVGAGVFTAPAVTSDPTEVLVRKLTSHAEEAFEKVRAALQTAPLEKHEHVSITAERVSRPLRIAASMGASKEQIEEIAALFAKTLREERQAVLAQVRGEEFEPEEEEELT